MPSYPTVDESRQRLHTFGWRVGETGGPSPWLVTGTNGAHTIHAEGRTQCEAWWRACLQPARWACWDRCGLAGVQRVADKEQRARSEIGARPERGKLAELAVWQEARAKDM
jgi:hypothetical protein